MGKGFNNYMCKKFFHPASVDNLKRVWMAEQKHDQLLKRQEELKLQYEKEQELFNNKALLSKESKDKLSVNFLYEPPPGVKDRKKEDGEPEYKFEWQRKYHAPREDYCKNNQDIRDQPFGILVRNVRCIKCHQWGHINTDRECPMFNQPVEALEMGTVTDPALLKQKMKEDGLILKQSGLGHNQDASSENQQLLESDDEEIDLGFIETLTAKQKKLLLRKLEKMEKKKRKAEKRKSDEKHSWNKKHKRKEKVMKENNKNKNKHSKKEKNA